MAAIARTRRLDWSRAEIKAWITGDSITACHLGSAAGGGQRAMVYQRLNSYVQAVQFYGQTLNATDIPPLTPTTVAGISHSGLDGAHGAVWYSEYWDSFFPAVWGSDRPDLVWCAYGTNDVDTAAAATNFARVMDLAARDCPKAHVLFATRPQDAAGSGATQAAQVRLEVAARAAAGQNVHLVDQHAVDLDPALDFSGDGVHPNDRGYTKLARLAWFPVFQQVLHLGRPLP